MRRSLPVLFVFVVACAVFAPAFRYDFLLKWDDGPAIVSNPIIREWSWVWITQNIFFGHWIPLTWLVINTEYHLWGLHAGGWHAVNVLLHAGNAVLVYVIARRLIQQGQLGPLAAALLFAVHPLRLESVVFITELRQLLMTTWLLVAVLFWLTERRGFAFGAFLLAGLSHSLAVTLPVLLLCLEWWRTGRVPSHLWKRLAPFFAVSVVLSVIAFRALHVLGNSTAWATVGLGPRLLQIAYSEVFYARQTLWPGRLSHLIEYTWVPSWGQPQYPIAVAILVLTTSLCVLTWRWWPGLTAALIGYAVAVFPQAGLFQNGPQLVANRYSYLACLPLALLAGAGLTRASRRFPRMAPTGAAVVVAAFSVVTLVHMPMWRNDETLWAYAAEHEVTCTVCQDAAAFQSYQRGDLVQTRRYLEHAIAISDTTLVPRWERHWNLATVLLASGQRENARRELRIFVEAVPVVARGIPVEKNHLERARILLTELGKEP